VGVVLLITGIVVEPVPLLKVSRLAGCYELSRTDIAFVIQNRSDRRLSVVLFVEKQVPSGQWIEFCSDLFQARAFPKQRRALVLEAFSTRQVHWHPYETGNFFCLQIGDYRLVANVYDRGPESKSRVVLAHFAVRRKCAKAGCPPQKMNPGVRGTEKKARNEE
jgi:hypothetical protein